MEIFSSGSGFGGMGGGEFFGSFIVNSGANVLYHGLFMGTNGNNSYGRSFRRYRKIYQSSNACLVCNASYSNYPKSYLEGSFVGIEFMFANQTLQLFLK
jgi:hypothetical protein